MTSLLMAAAMAFIPAMTQDKVAVAYPTEERIVLDGKLDEAAWSLAESAGEFAQWEPQPGAPATERTEVRFLYDGDNLYIGAICHDSEPGRLVSKELKEDFGGIRDTDVFGVVLDTLDDNTSGFWFAANPSGARQDGQYSNDGEIYNADWDGVWDVKVTVTEYGWVVEMVIPFKTLRFSNAQSQEWGLNMLRRIRRKSEDDHWSPLPRRYRVAKISMAGTLTGLEGIRQGRNFKVKPFMAANVTQVRSRGRFDANHKFDGGVDVKYGLTPQLTLDATYRTDFSQVEVDEQQVNLTRFNLFFPEKREFFLENAGTFSFGQPINLGGGGNNNVIAFFSRRLGLAADNTPIPIIGGARLSGKMGTYDVGFVGMKTERHEETPSNNFMAARVKKHLFGNSWVGLIATNRNSTQRADYNRSYGIDTRIRIRERIEVASYMMRTDTPGVSGKNLAGNFEAGWRGNDFSWIGSYHQAQENFNPAMGFVRRPNVRHSATGLDWRPKVRLPNVLNLDFSGSIDYIAGGTGGIETRTHDASAGIVFLDGSEISARATRVFDRLTETFDIRKDLSIPAGDYLYDTFSASYRTDQSRSVAGNVQYSLGAFWNGRRNSMGSTLSLKPNFRLNAALSYSRNAVRLAGGSFTTSLAGMRMIYAFSTKLFLNAFLQYNTDSRQFSSNIRFNFIHRPLSDVFIVYTDHRDTRTRLTLDRALALKVTRLFNF